MTARALENRCALITGASRGLGFEIAQRYLAAGANLMICARQQDTLDGAAAALKSAAAPGQLVFAVRADVAKASDVAMLVAEALGALGRIDILVNNAGIVGPMGALETVDWGAWLRTIEINLLGAVLVCRALLPHFKQAKSGKIIQLSGGGATAPMPMISAYAVSKAAVVRFVETLAEETRSFHIDVNALAPGALDTRLLDDFIAAGPESIGREFYERSLKIKAQGAVPLHRGADLAVLLGSARSDGITGKLISAVWDPWDSLPTHLDALRATDVYTLRRILPKDRGMAWGEVD